MSKEIGRAIARPTPATHKAGSESIPEWYRQFPAIYEIFKECGKSSKVPLLPSITVFAAGNSVRVCFRDREKKRSLFRTAETPMIALEAIDAAISTGTPGWRHSDRQWL